MPGSEAAAWTPAPRLAFGVGEVPLPSQADGPVASWTTNDGRELLGFRVAGIGWLVLAGVGGFRLGRSGVTALAAGGTIAALEDAWVRSVLPLAVQERGTQVLHASALAGRRGVVALCGVSTAGKSTLAAAVGSVGGGTPMSGSPALVGTDGAHGAGASPRVVADDALAFTVESGRVLAHPLPFHLRLRPSTQQALGLPELAAQADAPGPPAPLVFVVLLDPHGGDEAPVLTPVSPAEALGALMPHAYCFALEEGKEALVAAYAALVERVPVQRLSYPQRIDRVEEAAARLRLLLA